METLVVITTAPSEGTAEQLAQALVQDRLAACVQVLPGMTSYYRWEGKLEKSGEWLMLIKTTRNNLNGLTAKIESMHPYEVPEVVALEVAGGAGRYLDWVKEETKR